MKVGADRMLLFEFLDQLCAGHGTLRVPWGHPKDSLMLDRGKPAGAPVLYRGGFRVAIERLRIEHGRALGKDFASLGLVVGVMWPPTIQPLGYVQLKVDEILGADDRKLNSVSREDMFRWRDRRGYWGSLNTQEHAVVEAPAAGVRKLKSVKGHALFRFPLMISTLSFDKPVDAVGQRRQAGDYSIELVSYHSDAEGKRALLRGEGKEWKELVRDVVLVEARGREHAGKLLSQNQDRELVISFPKEAPSDRLEVRIISEIFDERLDFEFKDIELP